MPAVEEDFLGLNMTAKAKKEQATPSSNGLASMFSLFYKKAGKGFGSS